MLSTTRRTFLGAVTLATVARQVEALRQKIENREQRETGPLVRLKADPARLLSDAGMVPDGWQSDLLRSSWSRALLLCSRQSGKSQVSAAVALQTAFFRPGSLILLLSPTLRQSSEIFKDKLCRLYDRLGRPVAATAETALTLTLTNGSRVVSLPGEEGTIRSYSGVALLVIDEASRVPDDLYRTVRPMLATSRGRLIAVSTPFGKRGFFYDEWSGSHRWKRVKVTADECRRIPADFLEEERQALGDRWFRQEYLCSFEEMLGSVFSGDDIQALVNTPVEAIPFPA
jgi:hypothetical protein